jgi:hypothetical protein
MVAASSIRALTLTAVFVCRLELSSEKSAFED